MNDADTSASSAIADWTPDTVVPRSWTTAEIDTFISEVSTTSTNIAAASSTWRRRSRLASACEGSVMAARFSSPRAGERSPRSGDDAAYALPELPSMNAVTAPGQFTGDELLRLMSLLEDSDSAELKLTVPEGHQRSTIMALGLDPLEAQIRQVMFFDTPDLALDTAGVVVRARRIQGRGGDSVVKLRP